MLPQGVPVVGRTGRDDLEDGRIALRDMRLEPWITPPNVPGPWLSGERIQVSVELAAEVGFLKVASDGPVSWESDISHGGDTCIPPAITSASLSVVNLSGSSEKPARRSTVSLRVLNGTATGSRSSGHDESRIGPLLTVRIVSTP